MQLANYLLTVLIHLRDIKWVLLPVSHVIFKLVEKLSANETINYTYYAQRLKQFIYNNKVAGYL